MLEHLFVFEGVSGYDDLMTPPRSPDPADAGAAVPTAEDYDALCDEIARTQGIINLAEARLVTLTARNPARRNDIILASASTRDGVRRSSSTAPTTSPGPAVARPGARSARMALTAPRSERRTGIR